MNSTEVSIWKDLISRS